jgi:enoyl-CoA hydratase/carnithine racemase
MSEQPVIVERDVEISVITINRPERRNALNSTSATALRAAIHEASDSRVMIITGAGDAFCAGGDLDELERWSDLSPEEIGGMLYDSFQGMVRAVRAANAVVIAAINGAAVGAGLDLALACDMRVAAEGAKLGQVWVRLGVIPGTGGAWLTQALAGSGRAAELLLTGDLITAEDALAAGLVNRVVAGESLMDEARALAARVIRNPREGVIANKRAIVGATEQALEAALVHAREVQPERFTSDEFRSAVKAARRPS